MEGKTALGASSPANPALHIPERGNPSQFPPLVPRPPQRSPMRPGPGRRMHAQRAIQRTRSGGAPLAIHTQRLDQRSGRETTNPSDCLDTARGVHAARRPCERCMQPWFNQASHRPAPPASSAGLAGKRLPREAPTPARARPLQSVRPSSAPKKRQRPSRKAPRPPFVTVRERCAGNIRRSLGAPAGGGGGDGGGRGGRTRTRHRGGGAQFASGTGSEDTKHGRRILGCIPLAIFRDRDPIARSGSRSSTGSRRGWAPGRRRASCLPPGGCSSSRWRGRPRRETRSPHGRS